MIQTQVYTATPSQWALAGMHLDRRSEWTFFRVNGERYVALPSGNSGKTYWVRADGAGCSCPFYSARLEQCSHMLSVYLDATMDDLAEAPASLKSLRDTMPGCAGGCGNLVEARDGLWCDDCAAERERSERLAAARRRVVEEWV